MSDATPAAPAPRRNLYQRLAAITAEVQVKATGRTAQGQRTISIADTEDAIGELTARHGVVSGFRWNARPEIVGQEGKLSIWMADITAWLVNADDPTDQREEVLYDVGSSPSAAVSFALKRFYRALFHLATDEDEKRSVASGSAAASRDPITPGQAREQPPQGASAQPGHRQVPCPSCGKTTTTAAYARPDAKGNTHFCSMAKGGCGAAFLPGAPAPAVAESPLDATDYMPTSEEVAELYALAQALPQTAKDTAWVDEQLSIYSYRSVRQALLHQHQGQCGEGCEHVAVPAAPASKPEPVPDVEQPELLPAGG